MATASDESSSIWQGHRVRLRAMEPEDWATYDAWNADDAQARNLEAVPFPVSREGMRRWAEAESLRRPEDDRFRFVIETLAGEAVGDLTTHDCDRRCGTMAYGLSIRRDQRRRGFGSEAIALVLRYFFRELRYQKATVEIYAFNEASIRLHETLGFSQEGRLRRMTFGEGRFADILVYGLLVEEFEAGLARTLAAQDGV